MWNYEVRVIFTYVGWKQLRLQNNVTFNKILNNPILCDIETKDFKEFTFNILPVSTNSFHKHLIYLKSTFLFTNTVIQNGVVLITARCETFIQFHFVRIHHKNLIKSTSLEHEWKGVIPYKKWHILNGKRVLHSLYVYRSNIHSAIRWTQSLV